MTVNEYISTLSPIRAERISLVTDYIRTNYPQAIESTDYAPKTKFPTYKIDDIYVSIASMKGHISIHFGKYNATKIIAEAQPKVKCRVGCVNITDSTSFPIDAIRAAIDYCFS